jgi:hypothetical protein
MSSTGRYATPNPGMGAGRYAPSRDATGRPRRLAAIHAYFASDARRTAQTALGLIWLLDGGLQFQSFMYSKGFPQMLLGMTAGQPRWIASSVTWAAHLAGHNLDVYNTIFALVQVAIGVGLLYRPSVRLALALSFAWTAVVWWFGEAFGMLFMTMASPLTGAPGAVLLYALAGLVVWPNARPGGLLGIRGARVMWCALWLAMAYLWLQAPSADPNAISAALQAAPSGMVWLSSFQIDVANAISGAGVPIAFVLCALSAAIGIAVSANRRARAFLWLSIVLNLAYWVLGQGFGGMFQGGATDPNAAPPFILLAYVLYTLVPAEGSAKSIARDRGSGPTPVVAHG